MKTTRFAPHRVTFHHRQIESTEVKFIEQYPSIRNSRLRLVEGSIVTALKKQKAKARQVHAMLVRTPSGYFHRETIQKQRVVKKRPRCRMGHKCEFVLSHFICDECSGNHADKHAFECKLCDFTLCVECSMLTK